MNGGWIGNVAARYIQRSRQPPSEDPPSACLPKSDRLALYIGCSTLLAPAKEWEFGAIDEQFLRSISDRESVGIGLSPFGGAASYAVGHAVTLHADVTAGGVLFTNVVPYGKATRANFTVAPTPGVRWEPHNSMRIGTGYKLHHLSNASLGSTNPGMNSHIWYLSVGVVR